MRATGDRDRRPRPFPRPDDAPRRAPLVRNKTARRRRYIGAASAVVVAGVVTMGFLGGGTAIAEGGDQEVVFNGHCGLLIGAKSEPSRPSMSVTSGDKVTFTNNLGTEGVLYIGSTKTNVDEGDSKTVKLTNSTEAKMAPKCGLSIGDGAEKTTVTVNPKQDTDDGESGGGSNGGDSGDNGGSDGGDSGSDSGDNGSTAGGADKPDGAPDDGKKPTKSKADGKAGDATDGDDAKGEQDGAAAPDGSDSGDSDGTAKVDAANKVSTESSASALLAALAALCLAGVGFAALRTYISSRGTANA